MAHIDAGAGALHDLQEVVEVLSAGLVGVGGGIAATGLGGAAVTALAAG